MIMTATIMNMMVQTMILVLWFLTNDNDDDDDVEDDENDDDDDDDENDDIASGGATISHQDRSGFQGGAQIQQIAFWQIINV